MGIEAVAGEYSASGTADFEIGGQVVDSNLELTFADVSGGLTTRTGDETQLCVDIALDVADALLQLPLGSGGAPIVVPATGGSVSYALPEWETAIDVEVVLL